MAETRVTEKKLVRLVDPSNWENPVGISWVNKLGGWSHWVFKGTFEEKDQVLSEQTTESVEAFVDYEPYKHDVQYIEAWGHILERIVRQGMTVSAEDVDEDSRLRLRGLVHSNMIVFLLNPQAWDTLVSGAPVGPNWERISLDGSLYDFGDPGLGSYDITFAIKRQTLRTLNR
tara:strand:- start:9682 stop:10200 length:519 start_codon:yes stop_codon:yes gene_type:complete